MQGHLRNTQGANRYHRLLQVLIVLSVVILALLPTFLQVFQRPAPIGIPPSKVIPFDQSEQHFGANQNNEEEEHDDDDESEPLLSLVDDKLTMESSMLELEKKHSAMLTDFTSKLQQENEDLKRSLNTLQHDFSRQKKIVDELTKRLKPSPKPTKRRPTAYPTFEIFYDKASEDKSLFTNSEDNDQQNGDDDDDNDFYRPAFVRLTANTGRPTHSGVDGSVGTAYPTPRKTNMPTFPYSKPPTFLEEQEERYMEDVEEEEKEEEASSLIPIKFTPYSSGTVAKQIEEIFEFPKQDLSQLELETGPTVNMSRGVHVITTFFKGQYSMGRVRELLSSIVSNVENPYIAAVHVLWEKENPMAYIPTSLMNSIFNFKHKLILTSVQKQPTYRDLFKYANSRLGRGAIAIITNGDIYFDSSVGCLRTRASEEGDDMTRERRVAFSLSRRHSPLCGDMADHENIWVTLFDLCLEYTQAHDHFVFAPPIPSSMLKRVAHTQNAAYGAENVVIFEFRQANFSVFNYCHTIRGFHNHCVVDRHSSPHLSISKVPGRMRHGIKYPSGKNKRCEDMWVY